MCRALGGVSDVLPDSPAMFETHFIGIATLLI